MDLRTKILEITILLQIKEKRVYQNKEMSSLMKLNNKNSQSGDSRKPIKIQTIKSRQIGKTKHANEMICSLSVLNRENNILLVKNIGYYTPQCCGPQVHRQNVCVCMNTSDFPTPRKYAVCKVVTQVQKYSVCS